MGVYRLSEEAIGYANGSLLVAAVVAALAMGAVAIAYRPRLAVPAWPRSALLLALVGVRRMVGGQALRTARPGERTSPRTPRWIDSADSATSRS